MFRSHALASMETSIKEINPTKCLRIKSIFSVVNDMKKTHIRLTNLNPATLEYNRHQNKSIPALHSNFLWSNVVFSYRLKSKDFSLICEFVSIAYVHLRSGKVRLRAEG